MRLRVWTDPLKHADSYRQLPVVRSSGLSRNRFCGSCSCWRAAETRQEQQAAALPCSKVAWAVLVARGIYVPSVEQTVPLPTG